MFYVVHSPLDLPSLHSITHCPLPSIIRCMFVCSTHPTFYSFLFFSFLDLSAVLVIYHRSKMDYLILEAFQTLSFKNDLTTILKRLFLGLSTHLLDSTNLEGVQITMLGTRG
ncbi:uncharacterized protein LACBIDRAFT_299729 [Laccaria bicolor S238N-H82]|uniref:Predicted protein n=1 Tax=Laccaria bicolor (strain S238N-H82 / ATCC MYA-4686) TaxID=486041 RepID=B0DFA7_LACBS|nr:uncharacterized protein LACBIDRAFT_299729 [Laccaria bicolor S238N-H82]EDR06828.1 predicted protein [Laccaria bicolor S238N-H82]|eukprot:XP_001882675.1 predicted protein [Laccaria bicolor S238N-H82]